MKQFLDLINNEPRKNRVGELCFNDKLVLAAQHHNNDMLKTKNFFSHRGSDGSTLVTRINRVGYNYWSLAQNIAVMDRSRSVQEAYSNMMKSAEQKRNILNANFDQIGIAIDTQTVGDWKGLVYVTQIFGVARNEKCCTSSGPVTCRDTPSNWHDSDGVDYNCKWYASDARHGAAYGDGFRNFGTTANEACCSCGGGFK